MPRKHKQQQLKTNVTHCEWIFAVGIWKSNVTIRRLITWVLSWWIVTYIRREFMSMQKLSFVLVFFFKNANHTTHSWHAKLEIRAFCTWWEKSHWQQLINHTHTETQPRWRIVRRFVFWPQPIHQVSWKSAANVLSNVATRQTNQPKQKHQLPSAVWVLLLGTVWCDSAMVKVIELVINRPCIPAVGVLCSSEPWRLSPRLNWRRSSSTVLSQVCLGRPGGRLQFLAAGDMQACRARDDLPT